MPASPGGRPAVEAVDLVKRFGAHTAVDHVSFVVPEGSVLGLLGPNGAGKTTTVRMLTTLSVPTSGTGRVAGHDVVAEPDAVRHAMGLTGQAATVDELLTARENLWMIGRLAGLPPGPSAQPATRCWSGSASPTRRTVSLRRSPGACAGGWTWRSA